MPTIIDVAKKAGVSKSTISRYLNGERVKEENKVKIQKAITELNYQVNPIAKGLKTRKSYTVGVIIPNLTDLFVTHIIQSCEQYLNEQGYSIILCDAREDLETEKARMEFLISKRVDGIIMEPCRNEGDHIHKALKRGIPVVLIDRMISGLTCDTVLVDNINGAYEGVSALIRYGHRKIGIINGPDYIYTAGERYKGYRRALSDHGIAFNSKYVRNGFYKKEGGREAFLQLMTMEERPTAIFVTNYFMSVGVIEAVLNKGFKIPEDVSLLAFDSMQVSTAVDLSAIIKPSLSTIKQPMGEIGILAAQLLVKRMEDNSNDYVPQVIRLATHLNLTDSVAKII